MLRTETRTFDDLEVTSQQLPAMRALKLLPRLARLLAPALASLGTGKIDLQADVSSIANVLSQALEPLDDNQVEALSRDLLADTTVVLTDETGKRRNQTLGSVAAINSVFSGRLPAMLKAMALSVEVNFSDFFPASAPSAPPKESP